MQSDDLTHKSVLVIGGTGSLGRAIVSHLREHYPTTQITVLSRDEQKQQAMKKDFPHVRFIIGDIKDASSIYPAFREQFAVFHVAALKHIDHIEDNPVESVKTNILGTINVANACEIMKVPYCVFSSTDKAVDPLNTYGNCKAISERLLAHRNEVGSPTHFSTYRWGNVINSNGSAIPFFAKCIQNNQSIPLTDERMTRFWIDIRQAVQFIFMTFMQRRDEVLIPPMMKSASVVEVIEALGEICERPSPKYHVVGLRKGEKIHESLRSQHSREPIDSLSCDRYTKEELKQLIMPVIERVS
jgi:UDP-N-acetylglucosamine 4,6-dehydratase/5-epimerase